MTTALLFMTIAIVLILAMAVICLSIRCDKMREIEQVNSNLQSEVRRLTAVIIELDEKLKCVREKVIKFKQMTEEL